MTVNVHPARRIRIETTLDLQGRPNPHTTTIHLDDQDISDTVTSIDLTIDAKNPELAELAIRHSGGDITGNYRPLPLLEPILCVGCYVEHHAGQRAPEDINHAILNVGGNSTCREHVQIGPAPQLPGRTPGGIILGNGS